MATITRDLGPVTAYAYAVSKGYTGTQGEFAQAQADLVEAVADAREAIESIDGMTVAATELAPSTPPTATISDVDGHKHIAFGIPGANDGADLIADDFSTTKAYAVGDYVLYSGDLYVFTSAHAAGAWNASHVSEVKLANETTALKTELANIDAQKADKAGVYPDLTSGSAEQLLSGNLTENKVPYKLRQTGGNGADRVYLDKVVGGTVCWNQLLNYTEDIVVSTSNTSTKYCGNSIPFVAGHKYLYTWKQATTMASNVRNTPQYYDNANHYLSGLENLNLSAGTYHWLFSPSATTNEGTIGIWLHTPAVETTLRNFMLFDLTQMFGSTIADYVYSLETATAGAGVALLKSWGFFTEPYYAYNAGELISVDGVSERKTVGINQWDEEWEVGSYSDADGTKISDTDKIRSKNFIRVIPGATYYFKNGSNVNCRVFRYDENKHFISYVDLSNSLMTIPSDAHYLTFRAFVAYGTTYKNDICINLSDPTRNGTYEPYTAASYALDPDLTLRGIPKLDANNQLYYDGDEYSSDGSVKRRYKVINLDSITWILDSGSHRARGMVSDLKIPDTNVIPNVITEKGYIGIPATGSLAENEFAVLTNYNLLFYYDGTHTPTGYIVYEATSPTTEQADPFALVQAAGQGGTEEFVSDTIVPVGHVSRYPENARAKLDGLPSDFSTLIAPTEKAYKATQAYSSGSLFIVNNILYKATASIANGATITPGTNCTATTLAAVIAALN